MASRPWTLRSLLACFMVYLSPWDSFAKHSQVSGTKGSTSSRHQYSVSAVGGLSGVAVAVGQLCINMVWNRIHDGHCDPCQRFPWVDLVPWGSFAKHSQVSGAKGSTTAHPYSVLIEGVLCCGCGGLGPARVRVMVMVRHRFHGHGDPC